MELPSIRRIVKASVAVANGLLLMSACTANSRPAANPVSVPASAFEQRLADSCGQPVAYPISAKCVAIMGSVGPLLQHRSDLIMAIWRSCPGENPCDRVSAAQPACGGQVSPVQRVDFADGNESCRKAQEADYSCAALLNDPVYTGSLHHTGVPQDPYGCQRAKAALANFDGEVDRMSLRIRWYRVFAMQGY